MLALPESIQTALTQDEAALRNALATLPEAEQQRVLADLLILHTHAQLAAASPAPSGSGARGEGVRPDIDQLIQNFLPLLGDIALAAFGDDTARQLAEAQLPGLEQRGWQLSAAVQRIWQGQRDASTLTAGLDPKSAALIQRTLQLITAGPDMIFVAQSITIADLRRQANGATEQALAGIDAAQCAALARRFEELAAQAREQPGAPWQALAAELDALAARLSDSR